MSLGDIIEPHPPAIGQTRQNNLGSIPVSLWRFRIFPVRIKELLGCIRNFCCGRIYVECSSFALCSHCLTGIPSIIGMGMYNFIEVVAFKGRRSSCCKVVSPNSSSVPLPAIAFQTV